MKSFALNKSGTVSQILKELVYKLTIEQQEDTICHTHQTYHSASRLTSLIMFFTLKCWGSNHTSSCMLTYLTQLKRQSRNVKILYRKQKSEIKLTFFTFVGSIFDINMFFFIITYVYINHKQPAQGILYIFKDALH